MVARYLPDGMKMTVIATLFENVFENLLGYEGLFYLMSDDPQLVEDVFNRWGQVVYNYYASIIGLQAVGGIFHQLRIIAHEIEKPFVTKQVFEDILEQRSNDSHLHPIGEVAGDHFERFRSGINLLPRK